MGFETQEEAQAAAERLTDLWDIREKATGQFCINCHRQMIRMGGHLTCIKGCN